MSARNRPQRGATRTNGGVASERRRIRRPDLVQSGRIQGVAQMLKRLFKVTLVSLILALVGFGAYMAIPLFDRPIQRVSIEGDFKQVDQELLNRAVSQEITTTLLRLDIEELRNQLEMEQWVSEVQIRRQWPDQLWIRVTEQKPIARWGASGFVNQHGTLIEAPVRVAVEELPQLVGSKEDAKQVTAQYLLLSRALLHIGLEIKRLERSATGDWKIALENDVELLLGRGDLLGKTRRIIAVWDSVLKQQNQRIETIDARYSNGVAVNWLAETMGSEANTEIVVETGNNTLFGGG